MTARLARTVGMLLLILVAPAAAEELPGGPVRGDLDLMREVTRTDGVDVSPARPGLTSYASDAATTFIDWVGDRLRPMTGPLEALAELISLIGWNTLVMATLAVIVVSIALWLKRRAERGRVLRPVVPAAITALESRAPIEPLWNDRLAERLAADDVAGALEAIWWSLAGRLVGSRVDPAWTSRDLVRAAGRHDLMPAIRRLDRMIYARSRPAIAEVQRLWGDLQEEIG